MDIAPETATDDIVLPLSIPAEAVAGNRFLKSRLFRVGASYLVAAVGLAWAFKGTQWKALFGDIAAIRWGWVVPAVLLNILGTISQGFRWHLLLKPLGGLPTGKTTQALFSGFFINDVLPLRMGELARGYIVSSWMSREFVSIIPSMVLERLFEGIWLAIGIGLTAIIVRLPRPLDRAAGIFGLVVLALAGVVLYITLRKKRVNGSRTSEKLAGSRRLGILKSLLLRIEDGFRSIGLTRDFLRGLFRLAALFRPADALVLVHHQGLRACLFLLGQLRRLHHHYFRHGPARSARQYRDLPVLLRRGADPFSDRED